LLLLVFLAIAPAVALTLSLGVAQRQAAAAQAKDEALRLARVASANQARLIEGARQLLIALAELPEVRGGDPAECQTLLAALLRQYSLYANLGVADLDGDVWCSAVPFVGHVNIADRVYFQRAVNTNDFAIGEYQVGRVTGKPTVNFGYPLLDRSGEAQGIVFAALDLAWFSQLAAEAQLPSGAVLTVIDQKTTILARYPDAGQWVGKSVPDAPLVKAIVTSAGREGTVEVLGLDGVVRLYAFTPLTGGPDAGYAYISVGIPNEIAFAEVNQLLAAHLMGLGTIGLLVFAAAWVGGDVFILRRVNVLVRAAQRLAAGDLSARTGLSDGGGEISHLAHAFDIMAETLQQRETEHQRAEAALREAEAKYRALVEQTPAIVYTAEFGPTGQWQYVSPPIERLLGYSPEAWLANPELWITHLHPDDRERVLAEEAHSRAAGEPLHSEYRMWARDGRMVWFRDEAVVMRDAAGAPLFLQGVMYDVTERKQAEEALQESRRFTQRIADMIPEILYVYDLVEQRNVYVNREIGAVLGYPEDEIQEMGGTVLFRLTHPDDLSKVIEHHQHRLPAAEDGQIVELQYRMKHANGEWRWLSSRETVFARDVNGRPSQALGTAQDITQRQRAEAALREAEARYRTLVEQLPAIIYIVEFGPPNRTIYISPQVQSLLGFSPAEWMAEPDFWIRQLHPDDRERVLVEVQNADVKDAPLDMEYRVLSRDGRVVWFHNRSAIVPDETGRPRYAQGVLFDITAHRQAAEEIQRHAARAEALARIAARLNAQLDLDAVLNTVCEETAFALNVPIASVALYEPTRDQIRLASIVGAPPDYRRDHQPVPRALFDEYARRLGPLIVLPDAQAEADLPNARLYARHNIRTIVAATLMREGQLVGTLNVYTVVEPRTFSPDELALLKSLADQAGQAIANASLFDKAQQRLNQVQALRAIDVAITASLDLRLSLNVVLDQVTAQLRVDAADILLLNLHTQTLAYAAGRGFRTSALQHTHLRLGEGHAGSAALDRHVVSIPNLREIEDAFARAPLLKSEAFVSYYGVPLIAKGQVKGVLEVFHRTPLEPTSEWLGFLETLGGQAAIAIDNAQLFDSLQRSNVELMAAYDATIAGWSQALDLRDKETEGHTQRVTEMTVRLARAAGMSEDEIVHARRGALLHDIGKMGIPDAILLKPGPLTDEEWAIMRQHPKYAYELLSPVAFLRPALEIPYCHHEKWNGAGYPRGLKGEQIPLAARLFAVVDVWDALRSDRPYRASWPEEKVLEYLRAEAGAHFDPRAVEIFMEVRSGE